MGAAGRPRRPLAGKFLYVDIVTANACQHTQFQLSSSISFGDMRVAQNKKWELLSPDFPRRPLAEKYLYRELLRVNAYKCAKFQLPSSISYGDMEGVQK